MDPFQKIAKARPSVVADLVNVRGNKISVTWQQARNVFLTLRTALFIGYLCTYQGSTVHAILFHIESSISIFDIGGSITH
jgi:hypothetical protein